ncbi:glutathione S-transferase family protein [Kiloniella sp.]|uniref:glutathione S-transferase family protein n=1 Tax=Kiloniella sp. TaxID=1938587 RepID=UPI003B010E76
MMIFYTVAVSNYCAKVELVLALKGIEADHRSPPGGYGGDSYKAIVPTGTVPALVDDDLVLSESESINEYLEEQHPNPALLPRDLKERASTRMLSRFHDLKVEPLIRALFKHMTPSQRQESVILEKHQELNLQLSMLDQIGRFAPYVAGDKISLADCGFAPTLLLAKMMFETVEQPLILSDKMSRWHDQILQHPLAKPVLIKYSAAVNDWLSLKLSS